MRLAVVICARHCQTVGFVFQHSNVWKALKWDLPMGYHVRLGLLSIQSVQVICSTVFQQHLFCDVFLFLQLFQIAATMSIVLLVLVNNNAPGVLQIICAQPCLKLFRRIAEDWFLNCLVPQILFQVIFCSHEINKSNYAHRHR